MVDVEQENRKTEIVALLEKMAPLKARFSATRHLFHQFYDSWLNEARLEGAPVSFLHAVCATANIARNADIQLNPARSEDAVALALAGLGKDLWLKYCFSAAVASGLFDANKKKHRVSAHRKLLMEKILGVLTIDTEHERLQSFGLQRATSVSTIWTDPGHLLPALLLARRRLCKISTTGDQFIPVTGTGFLIGPSTILTNWHVVEHQAERLENRTDIKIEFDYSATTGLAESDLSVHYPHLDWQLAKSMSGATRPPGSEEYWWMDSEKLKQWKSSVKDDLDYAVIHLDSSPGLQRGWYDISEFGISRTLDNCWVLHHPSGTGQTVTGGTIELTEPNNPARILHGASTVNGSSGGLVLNAEGLPIGLHYLGLGVNVYDTQGQPVIIPDTVINVAIPLQRIAADLDSKNVLQKITDIRGIAPARGCLDGNRPVFGRSSFFPKLEELIRSEKRIMMVHTSFSQGEIKQPGKSFTIELLKGVAGQPENIHIIFGAGELKADGRKMAVSMLETFAPEMLASLPNDPDTTTPAFIKRLVSHVARALRDRVGNNTVWLVLDDLEKHNVSDASGREFLSTLYSRIENMPNLRIILIGLKSNQVPSGIEEKHLNFSIITNKDTDNREKLFLNWLDQRGARNFGINDTGKELLAGTIASYAGNEAPLAQMAEFVSNHMSEITNTLFGSVPGTGNGGD